MQVHAVLAVQLHVDQIVTNTKIMALSKAIAFVKAASISEELRTVCANFSKENLLLQLNFKEEEFEDAINMELVKCKSYEQAEVYQQIRIWFLLI